MKKHHNNDYLNDDISVIHIQYDLKIHIGSWTLLQHDIHGKEMCD